MTEQRPDAGLLIGLHKLAEQNGDGMVPELFALLARSPQVDMTNVVSFPPERRNPPHREAQDKLGEVVSFRR